MLIDVPDVYRQDPVLRVLARVGQRSESAEKIRDGVYEIGHFGMTGWPGRDWEQFPEFEEQEDGYFNSYGVCDNWEQVIEHCPEIEQSRERKFIITLTLIRKADEPADGGWRWHKWGPYIGVHEPQCEYIAHEPEIEQVYVYHVYEKVS